MAAEFAERRAQHLAGALIDSGPRPAPFTLTRIPAQGEAAQFVRHYWHVLWDHPGPAPFVQRLLPLPTVNVVLEHDALWVYGPARRAGERHLVGRGAVLGALLVPGAWGALQGEPVHLWVDRRETATTLWGSRAAELWRTWREHLGTPEAVPGRLEALGCLLLEVGMPPKQADWVEVGQWVQLAESDATIRQARELASAVGVSQRALERGFRRFLGLTPKSVIQRFRLLEAAGRIARGEFEDQTELALRLGFVDQPHFVREFRRTFGESPGRYAARVAPRVG